MNKPIIVATVVIAGSGVVNAWTQSKPLTPVILGSYVFMLVLSIADAFGGDIAKIASALAMLAMTYVLISEFPWGVILSTVRGGK